MIHFFGHPGTELHALPPWHTDGQVQVAGHWNVGSGVSCYSDFRAKQGFEVLQEEFGFGLDAPAEIVITAADLRAAPIQEAIQKLTNYQVSLLSRIREQYDKTGDNSESVVYGVTSTAGLITGAALIMVAVFGGFAAGSLEPLQQFGFGLAVAVLVDATLVRSVLVPATMKLLADRNWYLPGVLKWLPDFRVEGSSAIEPAGTADD